MENLSEMLGGITTCSIPFLDLPPQFHNNPEIGAGFIGYSEIFSGFSDNDFAISYQEFISERSDTSYGRVQTEVKEFSDHSTEAAENVISDIICNDLTEKATCNASFNDVEQEVTSSPSSTENSNPEGFYAKHVPVDYSSENVNNQGVTYTTVSSINFQTQPSIVPPPTKTPPKIIDKQNGIKFDIFKISKVDTGSGLIKQARNHQIQYKVGDSNCGNYIELDAQSAVTAMKEAMEQAQARLKHAKETMERKRGNIQSHNQLGHRANVKRDGMKELKTSENGKIFNVEDECCIVKGAESQLMGHKSILESSKINYKLEENSKEQKIEELYSELVSNDRSRVVKELSKRVDIENKLKTSSIMNEATEMKSYDSNPNDGSATYREENENLSDCNKYHTLNEIEQENNWSPKTLSSGEDLKKLSASEEIPFRGNLTKLDSLNIESLHIKSLDSVLVLENLQDDKEDGITHAARNDLNKCAVGISESFNEKHVSKNDVTSDVNRLKGDSKELKSEVEGEKKLEREHEKVQARAAEEEEGFRRGEKTELVAESKHAKAWERAKRTKNVARQKEHSKVQKNKVKAETSERQKIERALKDAKLRADCAAAERATAEARERAVEKALADAKLREVNLRKKSWGKKKKDNSAEEYLQTIASCSGVAYDTAFQNVEAPTSSKRYSDSISDDEVDPPLGHKGTLERQHAEKDIAEKNMHDNIAQREQLERNKLAESLDAGIDKWSRGKEGNLRALLSTLQFILGPDSGWQPISVTDVISAESLKRAYRKATLCVHPDKLQQRGAGVQQKYICEKVFDLLKEAWDRFNLNE